MNLEDITEFSKIKDIWNDSFHDRNALNEFLNNVVMNVDYGNGNGKMLPDFSDIYVLVSKKDSPIEKLALHQKKNNRFISRQTKLCVRLHMGMSLGIKQG